ncbi:MAG: hypothetical protein MZV65_30885 [Chromatiales bacterium]|nr:hypothetical protein [Chromatiales bacterium]
MREVSCPTEPVVGLLERLAYALLDENYQDDDGLIAGDGGGLPRRIRDASRRQPASAGTWASRSTTGSASAAASRACGCWSPWRFRTATTTATAGPSDESRLARGRVHPGAASRCASTCRLIEMANEVDCELAGDDAQEIWVLEHAVLPRPGRRAPSTSWRARSRSASPITTRSGITSVQLHRPSWATVLEKRQKQGDPAEIDRILDREQAGGRAPAAHHRRHAARGRAALPPPGRRRGDRPQRRDPRHDRHPHGRDAGPAHQHPHRAQGARPGGGGAARPVGIHQREARRLRDSRCIQLAREATALLSWAIDRVGDPFAIHGFASDGRHDVQYYRFKDFDQRLRRRGRRQAWPACRAGCPPAWARPCATPASFLLQAAASRRS